MTNTGILPLENAPDIVCDGALRFLFQALRRHTENWPIAAVAYWQTALFAPKCAVYLHRFALPRTTPTMSQTHTVIWHARAASRAVTLWLRAATLRAKLHRSLVAGNGPACTHLVLLRHPNETCERTP
jgi:hypothetical protein